MRKSHEGAFKAKVVLEVLRGEKTIAQIGSEYGVHPNQIGKWKRQVLEDLPRMLNGRRRKEDLAGEQLQAELYREIGQLKVELDWLKKKSGLLG